MRMDEKKESIDGMGRRNDESDERRVNEQGIRFAICER
jgi:hypothetical protein